jgi:acetylornithine deacetylase/succinyl-diaminopimelate desuccinylase-like protein
VKRCAAFLAALLALGCSQSAPPEFSAESAWRYLVRQCDFGPRVPGSPEHAQTVRYLTEQLQAHGATVQLQRFEITDPYDGGVLPLTNIIGSFLPSRTRRVLLVAHYDTRPRADQETVDSLRALPILGANDAASGVAVLLEIGRLIAQRPPDDIGVDIVFFDGEDFGKEGDLTHYLLGSKYFAANLAGYRPVCGILLDMVGAKDAEIRQEGNSLAGAPRLTTNLFARAARLELDVFVPERFDPMFDDHIPLLRAGIPTVDLIGLPYEHWHTLADTPEACDPETLRQVGTLLLDFLYDFDFEG